MVCHFGSCIRGMLQASRHKPRTTKLTFHLNSNALALEYTASHNPHAGSLITFTQFLLVALAGLRHRLYIAPFQPRNRDALADEIARALLRERANGGGAHIKVAVQGSGPAGELCGSVAERLRTLSPVSVIRASQSGFVQAGKTNWGALKHELLDPLMPSGSQKYITRAYDPDGRVLDRPRVLPTATRKSILLVDGEDLLVDRELGRYWDFVVILDSDASSPRDNHVHKRPRMIVQNAESKPRITWTNVVVPMPLLVKLFRLRFRPLKIPLSHWIVQVVLFLITSLLNNAAFKYSIPMVSGVLFLGRELSRTGSAHHL